jgi:hypothetical protein
LPAQQLVTIDLTLDLDDDAGDRPVAIVERRLRRIWPILEPHHEAAASRADVEPREQRASNVPGWASPVVDGAKRPTCM